MEGSRTAELTTNISYPLSGIEKALSDGLTRSQEHHPIHQPTSWTLGRSRGRIHFRRTEANFPHLPAFTTLQSSASIYTSSRSQLLAIDVLTSANIDRVVLRKQSHDDCHAVLDSLYIFVVHITVRRRRSDMLPSGSRPWSTLSPVQALVGALEILQSMAPLADVRQSKLVIRPYQSRTMR